MNQTIVAATKAVNRLNVAMADLAGAMRAADALLAVRLNPAQHGEHGPALEEAAAVAAIVSYARPFVPSNSGGVADRLVIPADLGMFEGREDLAKLHKEMVEHRHQAVAHSDWSRRSTVAGATSMEHYWQVKQVEIAELIPDALALIGLIAAAQDAVMRKMFPLLILISHASRDD